jgi:hypothetical protein
VIIVDVLAFYGFQFDDYWTTILGLRKGAQELNPFASPYASSPLLLGLYKFGLGTFALIVLLIMMQFSAVFTYILYADVVGEALITFNNTLAIYRHKKRKRSMTTLVYK